VSLKPNLALSLSGRKGLACFRTVSMLTLLLTIGAGLVVIVGCSHNVADPAPDPLRVERAPVQQLDADRSTPLAEAQAITQQDLDNAVQNNMAAQAQLQAAQALVETSKAQISPTIAAAQADKAAVETAQINLGFTRLTSPIDGIPGIAQLQGGALMSPASGAITTVSTSTLSTPTATCFRRTLPWRSSACTNCSGMYCGRSAHGSRPLRTNAPRGNCSTTCSTT
jgi:hypothetical protein